MVFVSPFFALILLEFTARLKYSPEKAQTSGIFEYHNNKVFSLKKNYSGKYSNTNIITNKYGYRDEDFPNFKPENEIRILTLGDSVTFGAFVSPSETYTEHLEDILAQSTFNTSTQVINAGAPGNGPMQEYYDLEEGLRFNIDGVLLQFTLNDVTEPFVFLKRLGGSGWSYHGVQDIPAIDYYLGQRSALYCLSKIWYAKMTYQGENSDTLKERGKKQEIYQKEKLITHHDHENIREAWDEYFDWLTKIADTCRDKKLPLIILICPFEFQLHLPPEQDYPQKKIISFCEKSNISHLNLIDVLRADFESQNLSYSNRAETEKFWDHYFYDHDHFTLAGHKFVAELLLPLVMNELGLTLSP